MKKKSLIILACLFLLSAAFILFFFSGGRPSDAKLVRDFNAHRAAFEQLRDMLLADKQLSRVSEYFVEGKIPDARIKEYRALLKQMGGKGAYRSDGEVGVAVWSRGFGGDIMHINVCSREQEPSNQVSNLDEHFRKDPGSNVYRHLEGNWYLWAD